ncbi:transcriptional regulator [Amycolatopsis deserti]|uniref:Transcriptional regulator n=1 Tax=Amycolatopsis deserti TaxID=185696 RepID=A0ABQ3JG82_9PSEU|nr:helix-turn-helix domain-containing protein [Amycolatopsis deserti]GHF25918.1 transcriptional regulator [Amycolatopsis deserti]
MRSYDDPCGVARALDAVGERWALLVVREVLLGPKRFRDLSRSLPGMSQNVLSQRLRELEGAGVVRRRRLGPPASTSVYELTEHGAELEAVVMALARWGSRRPVPPAGELSVDALVLALRTTFSPALAEGLSARVELQLGDDTFTATIDSGEFSIRRAPAEDADVVLRTDATRLRSLVFLGQPLTEADVVAGEFGAAERFVRCFPRPGA